MLNSILEGFHYAMSGSDQEATWVATGLGLAAMAVFLLFCYGLYLVITPNRGK